MNQSSIQLEPLWKAKLADEFDQDYMIRLKAFLLKEKEQGHTVYPKDKEYFHALNTTPLDQVRVVILGQDPYHGPGQAHGLCFSVPQGVAIPPSLRNIYKEIASDLGLDLPDHGFLENWAAQGVLLLNSVLTVQKNKAASHQNQGWETFTDRVINVLNTERDGIVFMLWGNYAHKKGAFIDNKKHLVLKAPHPSPLSAHRGFLGCRHFSKANSYLKSIGKPPIDWGAL